MAWQKLDTETLSGSSDTVTISGFASKKFNMFMTHLIGTGDVQSRIRLGNGGIDSGSNYAHRASFQGGSDVTLGSQTLIDDEMRFGTWTNGFRIGYIINFSGEEKLLITNWVFQRNAGAGNNPSRGEGVSKWVNTSNQFDNLQMVNTSTGDFSIDSNLSALGTD